MKQEILEELLSKVFGCDPAYYPEREVEDAKIALEIGYKAAQPKWISVSVQHPPKNIELLVKSPEGLIHLTDWREAYHIFACQNKSESSYDWQWMEIPN